MTFRQMLFSSFCVFSNLRDLRKLVEMWNRKRRKWIRK